MNYLCKALQNCRQVVKYPQVLGINQKLNATGYYQLNHNKGLEIKNKQDTYGKVF